VSHIEEDVVVVVFVVAVCENEVDDDERVVWTFGSQK
jgi:hypothetical protein